MTARDIYNRHTDVFGGSFSADDAMLNFPLAGHTTSNAGAANDYFGVLVQSLQTTYQQNVTRLYEVGRPAIYYVGGRTSGTMAMQRVVGPRTIMQEFYKKYGDVCQAATNTIEFTMKTGCGLGGSGAAEAIGTSRNGSASIVDIFDEGSAAFTTYFNVLTAISLAVQSQDSLINESLQFMFSSFQYDSGNA